MRCDHSYIHSFKDHSKLLAAQLLDDVPFPHDLSLRSSSTGAMEDKLVLTLARLVVGESQDTVIKLGHVV